MATPTVADKSYADAAALKRATKSVVINTELTWYFSEAKYKQLSDIEKNEKQLQKAPKKQKQTTGSETKETFKIHYARQALVSLGQTRTPERYFRQTEKGLTASLYIFVQFICLLAIIIILILKTFKISLTTSHLLLF